MTKPSAVRGIRRYVSAVLAVVAVAACSKGEKAGGGGAQSSQATARGTTVPPVPGQPGALPKPIDQMTGEELYAFTRQLTFGGGVERERRCRGRRGCGGARPTDSTVMRVDAVEGEDSLSAGGIATNGVIGARALNKGSLADSVYNTQPGADREYFLLVLPAAGGTATWRLEELTTAPGSRAHRSVATGRFNGCGHPFQRGARADFKTCAQAAAVRPAAFHKFFQTDGEPPIWIGCAAGCCTADPGDGIG